MTGGEPAIRRRWLIFLAFVALGLLTRGLSLGIEVIDKDEAAHIVGSWELLRGGLLYTDFADNKPPLVYVYYALAQLVFGRGLGAVHLLNVLLLVPLTAYAASAFYGHARRGILAGLIVLIYGAAFFGHDVLAAHGELLGLLPAAWAVVLVRDEGLARRPLRAAAAGLLIGVATLFKPTYALLLLALALAVAPTAGSRRWPRQLATLLGAQLVGFALPLVATYAAFVAAGGGDELVFWTIVHNLDYAANPIPLGEAAERFASYLLPFVLTTVWLWWGWPRSRALLPSRYVARLVSWLLIWSLPPVFLGLRFFPHYFVPLYLPLALAAAPAVEAWLAPPLRRRAWAFLAHTAVVFLGFSISTALLYFVETDVYEETRPVFGNVAAVLKADRCSADASLFVWGFAPQLYYAAALRPASRFVVPQAGLTGYVPGNRASASDAASGARFISGEQWDWLIGDLRRSRATYIVDTAPSALHRWHNYPLHRFPRLWELVRNDYETLGAVDRVVIYRRRGCGGDGAS